MTNEEKILEMLGSMQENMASMQADLSSLKDTVAEQGKLLQEVDQRSTRTQVLLETQISDKLQLLFEGHQTIMETMAPVSRVKKLEEDVDLIKSTVRLLAHDVAELKKAQ